MEWSKIQIWVWPRPQWVGEFYKHTRVVMGTVIINGARYENPIPTAMYWRPDRMICECSSRWN